MSKSTISTFQSPHGTVQPRHPCQPMEREASVMPPKAAFTEEDVPAEWRIDLWEPYGEVIDPATDEELEAIELDRR